jgi:hypothetical protein
MSIGTFNKHIIGALQMNERKEPIKPSAVLRTSNCTGWVEPITKSINSIIMRNKCKSKLIIKIPDSELVEEVRQSMPDYHKPISGTAFYEALEITLADFKQTGWEVKRYSGFLKKPRTVLSV